MKSVVEHGRSGARPRRSDALSALRARTAASRAERRQGLDVRRRRARHDRARSGPVGHLDDRSDDPQAGVVPDDADEHAAQERSRDRLRARRAGRHVRLDDGPCRTRARCPASRRRIRSIQTTRRHRRAHQPRRDRRLVAAGGPDCDSCCSGPASPDSDAAAALAQAKTIFEGLQHGRIDRALFTSNANAYFTDARAGRLRVGARAARPAAGVRAGRTSRCAAAWWRARSASSAARRRCA